MKTLDGLVPIGAELVVPASATAAAAFMDDWTTEWSVPDPKKRPNLRYVFEYYLRRSVLGAAEGYVTSPACEGVAVWQDSLEKDSPWLALRVNPLLALRCGWRYPFREMATERLAEKAKKRYAPAHHMYLALLAVRPDCQGKGLAAALLRPMLRRLDEARLAAWLETQNLKNVALYRHFGFEVVDQAIIRGAGKPLYFMLRNAVKGPG